MTQKLHTAHDQGAPLNAESTSRGRRENTRSRLVIPISLQLLAMIGIGALVYSSAADWFATLNHNAEVSGYIDSVTASEPEDLQEALDAAREYNSHMPAGVLRDPYTSPSTGTNESDSSRGITGADSAYAHYEKMMSIVGTPAMGTITYPRLGIGLPVYHGTSEEVLVRGAGHLYGSSLPVGGPSTHSVLTSHSGLVNASLFTSLPKAKLGDTFTVQVLGETRWYEVDQIETVLPEQTEGLGAIEGKDYVTLITCTPTGINSHRLLVRGERIDPPASAGQTVLDGDGKRAGFPWWALIFVGGSAVTGYLLFAPARPKKAIS